MLNMRVFWKVTKKIVEALHILHTKYNFYPTVEWIGQSVDYGIAGQYFQEMTEKIKQYNLEKDWHWLVHNSV